MKDRKIGDIFKHPVEGMLCVSKEMESGQCLGCVFNSSEMCVNEPDRRHTGNCAAEMRIDGCGVVFVKAEGGEA